MGDFLNALVTFATRSLQHRTGMEDGKTILMSAATVLALNSMFSSSQLLFWPESNFTIQIADPKQSPTIDAEDIQR